MKVYLVGWYGIKANRRVIMLSINGRTIVSL